MIIVLEQETSTCMRLLGAKNISELGPRFVSFTPCFSLLTLAPLCPLPQTLTFPRKYNTSFAETDFVWTD